MTSTLPHLLKSRAFGLYRLKGDGANAAVSALCRIRHADLICINGERVRTKRRFLAVLVKALKLPQWFGMNWDALADSLTDFPWQQDSTHVFLLTGFAAFARYAPLDLAAALAVLEDAASFWAERDVQLLILFESSSLPLSIRLADAGLR
jgi:hypothetical protein